MKYQAILFDADGMTLMPKRFSEQIQQDYGITWEKMKPFFSGPFQDCKVGKADLKEELAKVVGDWGWTGTVDELVKYWFSIGSTPDPEVTKLAKKLRTKGVKVCLATNQEKYRAEYLRNVVGLKDVFDELIISAEIGNTKNQLDYFQSAYSRLIKMLGATIPKDAILFVDHDQENLTTAKNFGFATYNYHNFSDFQDFLTLS